MGLTNLPKPESGKTLESSGTAAQWQRVMDACELIENLTVQAPLRMTKSDKSILLGVDVGKSVNAADVVEAGRQSMFVIVRSIGQSNDRFVRVQPVIPTIEDCTWTGQFNPDEEEVDIGVWPGQVAGDYAAFLWPTSFDPMTDDTPILAAKKVAGCWWLPQYLRFRLPEPSQSIPFGDCTPHIVTGP